MHISFALNPNRYIKLELLFEKLIPKVSRNIKILVIQGKFMHDKFKKMGLHYKFGQLQDLKSS